MPELEKATVALQRYHERFRDDAAEPVWLEKAFTFRMGRHTLRGRVDRVDKLPDGSMKSTEIPPGVRSRFSV